MIPIPLSSASCFISRRVTGMPALRKFMAMPPPMVPAPMTATFLIERAGEQVAVDDLVEQLLARRLGEPFARHRLAADDHVECVLDTDDARQALRSAGTGQQADLHFRQRHLRARRRHAVVATERELQ